MRFSMALRIGPAELEIARPADMTCSKHLSVVNDIWSYEKEFDRIQDGTQRGWCALFLCVHLVQGD
jgi:aristolochene synthase